MNYKNTADDVLITGILNGSFSAEFALINRYRGFSYILAKQLLEDCSYSELIDLDDLISIGLTDIFVAIQTYKLNGKFKNYWTRIAKNDMKKHISEITKHFGMFSQLWDESMVTSFSNGSDDNGQLLYEDIVKFLEDPENCISKRDKDMFLMYVEGYDFEELSEEFGIAYLYVNRKITRIRKKLINYLKRL